MLRQLRTCLTHRHHQQQQQYQHQHQYQRYQHQQRYQRPSIIRTTTTARFSSSSSSSQPIAIIELPTRPSFERLLPLPPYPIHIHPHNQRQPPSPSIQVKRSSIQIKPSSIHQKQYPHPFRQFHLVIRSYATQSSSNQHLTSDHGHHPITPKPTTQTPSLSNLKRLVSLARPETKTLSIAAGLLLLSSGISLSMPFLWGRVIDIFTNPELLNNFSVSLPKVIGILTAGFLIGSGANTLRIILMHIAGQRIINRLRTTAFDSIIRADLTWHELRSKSSISKTDHTINDSHLNRDHSIKDSSTTGTGDLVSRLANDCHLVGDSITRDLADGTRALATVLAGVSMMFIISSKLTLVMLTVVPPTAIGAVFFGQYLKKLSHQTQLGLGQITSLAEERINQIRTLHAFNSIPIESKSFQIKANHIFELARKEAYARGLFFGGSGFTGNATIIALLTYGGTLVSRGEISVGDLSSLMMYTVYVGSSLVGLSSWFATLMKGLGASSRIFELLDAKPVSVKLGHGRVLSATEPVKPVSFKNVHFSYPARPHSPILRGLDLTITPGSSLAIAGSSGSGKSTLAYLLLRFYDPQSGIISYGDEPIKNFTPESWRSQIGSVPQDPALLRGTIKENITYGMNEIVSESRISEVIKISHSKEFIDSLPQGLSTEIGPKGIQLSGGQRQRLAIARALIRDPRILILDEATSALDTRSENLVNLAIHSLMNSKQLTTIIIAHRLSTLKTADQIVYMENGRIVESGSYEELSKDGSRFNLMIRSQLLGSGFGSESRTSTLSEEVSDSLSPSSSSSKAEKGL